jgi:glycosyltransferase involved in cell wall biosynthesis
MNLKRMQICFVGNMLGRNTGYVTTQGQIVADLLADDGYQICCVSSKINRAARLLEIVRTLVKNNRSFDAVVLEVYSGLSFIIAETVSFLCRVFQIPLVMILHGGNLPEFAEQHPRRTKRVLKRAAFLAAPSAFLAEKIGAHGFEIRVIPNVVNLENYPFRERRAIKPRLVWMRAFHEIYNPQMAVEVLAELRRSVPEATLTMAGRDKGLENEIKQTAREMNLSGAIRFAGFLNEKAKIKEFAEADIYINTNRVDNMPVSVVEACAFGLPVVATKVGGLPYLITDGENGLLVGSENAGEMAAAIKSLLDNPELAGKISRGGRLLAGSSAWSAVRLDWEKLFAEIFESKTRRKKNRVLENHFNPEKIESR